MIRRYASAISAHYREIFGLACFLTWLYGSLFGCNLFAHHDALAGTISTMVLEHTWMWSCLFAGIGGCLALVVACKVPSKISFLSCRICAVTAALLCATGSLTVHIGSLSVVYAYEVLPFAGACMGFGIALFAVLWAKLFSKLDSSVIESGILISFAFAFILYFMLLLAKPGALLNTCALIVIVGVSALMALQIKPCATECVCWHPRIPAKQGIEELKEQGGTALMAFVLWAAIAFFRVISSPEFSGNRFTHYLIPFSCACVLSLLLAYTHIRTTRHLNMSLAYRWSMPLMMASCIPLIIDYDSATLRIVAYAVNFLGMFGVQFGFWMGICKKLHREKSCVMKVMGCYVAGEGFGIAVGCFVGLSALHEFDFLGLLLIYVVLLTLTLLVVSVAGLTPNLTIALFTNGSQRFSDEFIAGKCTDNNVFVGDHAEDDQSALEATLDDLLLSAAKKLQDEYQLTARETDVAALLIAGRSRSYIRDKLLVSINTVGSHTRSIFVKCGVHSQQELIDLARSKMSE